MSACGPSVVDVITCVVHYTIDPDQIAAFEQFARAWMRHVDEHGGTHHGYYLPAEGVSDRAESLFSFPSLAAYEQYRELFGRDPDFIAADRIRIVDFKTGRRAPASLDEIPSYHLRQIAAYVAALRIIFPDRPVEGGLLYTAGPALFMLPGDLVDRYKPGFATAEQS